MTTRRSVAVASLILLASCVGRRDGAPPGPIVRNVPPAVAVTPPPPLPPPPADALAAGVTLVSASAFVDAAAADRAWRAFKLSCPALLRRPDASGLTRPEDWRAACGDDIGPGADFAALFRDRFEAARVGDGVAFSTGYFEPEIAGSRVLAPGYEVPVYAVPPDIVRGTLADGSTGRGRVDETGAHVLYHDRAAIDGGALAGRGLEIAYAADAIDLFFLQIQGSGRLRTPDGGVMRIGYAGQNGREYLAIGRVLKQRGLLGPGQTSMQGIVEWLRANPDEGRAVMNENKSYVFFRELTGPGPLGSIGVPVTGRATVAVDPKFVPYGAPVVLAMDNADASGVWIAQDTGGAIRGPNRFDTFWGAGEEAKRIAGGMQARGQATVLLPKGTVARLRAAGARAAGSVRAANDARAQR